MNLTDKIYEPVNRDAAIRTRLEPQPTDATGIKVFPPTYQGPRNSTVYATEQRKIDNKTVKKCVVLDSVQSQAKRHVLNAQVRTSKHSYTVSENITRY